MSECLAFARLASFLFKKISFKKKFCCLCPAELPDTDSKISVSFPFLLAFTAQELLAYGL